MKRKQAMQIYGHLYKKNYPVMKDEVCQCCGVSTDLEWDHCPAITTAQLFARNDNIRFILVLLCKECNQSLSDKLLPDFPSRFYFCKEALLERYKGDLVSECRDNMTNTLESLKLADAKFTRLLDRIGFGLVKIDQLSDKHLAILNLETVSGYKIIDHLSERPGHGLLSESNLEEDNEDEPQTQDDADAQDEANRSGIPSGKKKPKFESLAAFKVFLRNELIYTKNGYETFLKEQRALAEQLQLPSEPTQYFNCDWQELTSDVVIVSESGNEYSLDTIEQYVTSDMVGVKIIGKRNLVKLLDDLEIYTGDEYRDLWNALSVHTVDVVDCLPEEPETA